MIRQTIDDCCTVSFTTALSEWRDDHRWDLHDGEWFVQQGAKHARAATWSVMWQVILIAAAMGVVLGV